MKKFDFTIKGNKYHVHLKDFEDNMATIEVNGSEYSVQVHQEVAKPKTPKLVRKAVVNKPGEGTIKRAAGSANVKAPLPGNIFKIMVAVGDQIAKGDTVLIMEAMKMENEVKAEKEGVVKEIKVSEGDAVLQSDVLIVME